MSYFNILFSGKHNIKGLFYTSDWTEVWKEPHINPHWQASPSVPATPSWKENKMRMESNDKRKRIYISGPITGMAPQRVSFYFNRAVMALSLMGYAPVNPYCLAAQPFEYEEFMTIDMAILELCDGIYMLKGWENSEGAKREKKAAEDMGLEVLYEAQEMEKNDAE